MQQMKILRIKIFMVILTLGALLWGCDSLIYDDLSDCPQGVYVKFFAMTPCDVDSTLLEMSLHLQFCLR